MQYIAAQSVSLKEVSRLPWTFEGLVRSGQAYTDYSNPAFTTHYC